MTMKFSEIEIPDSNPFQYDQLNRKGVADLITSVIINQESSFVLGLNAEWGTGKTTFVKMWKRHLEITGCRCIYYNAWENDFSEDSFVSFVSHIKSVLKPETQSEFAKKAKGVAKLIIKRGIPLAIKVATHGLIDTSGVDLEETGESVEEFTKGIAEDAIKNYEDMKESISSFRASLAKIVAEDNEKKKLIIFVDELDRCQPLYAIELLERIKHIFNVEGILFILSIDRLQLSTSIKSLYGSHTNSDAYLKRIINLDFSLPVPTGDQFMEYCLQKTDLMNKCQTLQIDPREVHMSIRTSIKLWELSLREIEHFFVSIQTVIISCISSKRPGFPNYFPYFALLLALKIKNSEQYENHVRTNNDSEEIVRKIRGLPPAYREGNLAPILSGLVFFSEAGTPQFDQQFDDFLKSFGSVDFRPEELRSFLQSRLFRRGREGLSLRTETDRIIKLHSLFS